MIFADIEYEGDHRALHEQLSALLCEHFPRIKSGLQGDSWFWIFEGEEKVAIDTFSSMKHQVKSESPGLHVQKVIETLSLRYKLRVYEKPEIEAHEED